MKSNKLTNKKIKMDNEVSSLLATTNNLQKYVLNIFVQHFDNNRTCTSEHFTEDFTNVNNSLLEARRKAIQMAQNYFDVFESSNNFSTYWEAEHLDFRNYSCFSINIQFMNLSELDNEGIFECVIYGEEMDEILESLELEAEFYLNHLPSENITIVELELDEKYRILAHDIDFILEEHLV
ncbi:hypothetical protein [Flavobacterium sp. GP15]|uniref:hypothetical protein n=1 Tax=Flavobacterium sp. GP15 TaxID=2758567 RepID=UPI00165D73AD|nr:hypothetical protein [Flavobacterium sp. GP15]